MASWVKDNNGNMCSVEYFSTPDFLINPARFCDSNDEALADMKRLAEASMLIRLTHTNAETY